MDAYENLVTRRSVKSYIEKEIPRELLEKIVYAGQCAPTGRNRQEVGFVVVTNKDRIKEMSKLNADVMNAKGDPFYGAQAVIVVLVNTDISNTYEYDGALAMGNLMNAAHALGISSCWIHRAREMFLTDQGKQWLQEWGFEDSYVGIGNCILGYSDAHPEMLPRKSKVVYCL